MANLYAGGATAIDGDSEEAGENGGGVMSTGLLVSGLKNAAAVATQNCDDRIPWLVMKSR